MFDFRTYVEVEHPIFWIKESILQSMPKQQTKMTTMQVLNVVMGVIEGDNAVNFWEKGTYDFLLLTWGPKGYIYTTSSCPY